MIRGIASIVGRGHWRNQQAASKALPDSGLSELWSQLQHLTDANAHNVFDVNIWPAAYAAEATGSVLKATAPVLDPNTKYVLGPDGNPLIDLSTQKPIVEDWYQLVVGVQTGLVKGIDATLRKLGVPQAFGWTIVVYTFFIKVLTYPLQRSSAKSMTMMKVTAPKLNEISNSETLSLEVKSQMTETIYEVAGENPLSGCLPILATFPIYFTLISAWRRLAYEKFPYYTESWLWIPNLAQPNPDFRMSVDWMWQFNAAGDPLMGWHDYLSYLILPVVLVTNTIITAFQTAKKDGKGEGPPFGFTLFSVVLVGSIALDLPQAYGLYFLANQLFTAGQNYLANESMRSEIPGFEEFEKTGEFPDWSLDKVALKWRSQKSKPTSLHQAAQFGNDDAVISFLEDKSIDIDAWDEAKVPPIAYAVARGNVSTMKLLMSRGANMQALDGVGHTLFHFAAFYSQAKVMKELVEMSKDAYPDNSWALLEDESGITPLAAASVSKDLGMIELFESLGLTMLKPPEEPVVPAPTSLHEAAKYGNDDAVTAFLDDKSVDIDAEDEENVTPIGYAVANGRVSTVKLLISRGANIQARDEAGRTLFHFAAFSNNAEVMKELVEVSKGIYPDNSWALLQDESGMTPLSVASVSRGPAMINLFKGWGLKLSPEAMVPAPTSLHEAAKYGNNDAVTACLEDKSVDIDARDEANVTPIGYAVAKGHVSTVKLLMSRGANMNATDGAGHTLFHFAAFYGQAKVMRELVEVSQESYPDNTWALLKDQNGQTPMDAALFCKDPAMIELLQSFGLKVLSDPQPMVTAEEAVVASEGPMNAKAAAAAAALAVALPTNSEAVMAPSPPLVQPMARAARAVD